MPLTLALSPQAGRGDWRRSCLSLPDFPKNQRLYNRRGALVPDGRHACPSPRRRGEGGRQAGWGAGWTSMEPAGRHSVDFAGISRRL